MKIEALEHELPPAILLLGPDRLVAWKLATQVIGQHGVHPCDCLRIAVLNAAQARAACRFAGIAPFGNLKVIAACTDGASAQAQNILLKVLEEPPDTVRFILVATARPLLTVMSRCQVITVDGEASPPDANQKVTAQVTAALTAARASDLRGLDASLAGWGPAQHAALETRMTRTSLSGADARERWDARRMLGALGRFSGASPRLAAHAALITVLSDKEQHA